MTISINITGGADADLIGLCGLLDEELVERYGEMQEQFDGYNKLDGIMHAVVVYLDGLPAACGALREYDADSAELKRLYVAREHRRKGFAKLVVGRLEDEARNKGFSFTVLETGNGQPEAISLYKSCGYEPMPNYGPYAENPIIVCMKKSL